MEKAKAIELLKNAVPARGYEVGPFIEAVCMAISALEAYVPDTNAGDIISRQGAMERLMAQNVIMDGSEYHNGFNAGVNRAQEVIRNLPTVQPKNGTLIIPLNESDFKSVKRIILDNKPWCRTFYEDVPGEAHWIKKYTPDDGEIYECDNCGVTWQFTDGGPEENEAFFCPKCGFKMMPKEEEEADGQE